MLTLSMIFIAFALLSGLYTVIAYFSERGKRRAQIPCQRIDGGVVESQSPFRTGDRGRVIAGFEGRLGAPGELQEIPIELIENAMNPGRGQLHAHPLRGRAGAVL